MTRTKILFFIVSFLFAFAMFFGWFLFVSYRDNSVKVIFLDVGEGDAILVRSGSTEVLIDSGADPDRLLAHLGRHIPFWDRTIEVILATHPDRDHIGGFAKLLRLYRVESVFTNGAEDETDTEKEFFSAIGREGVERRSLRTGSRISLPDGKGVFDILHPTPEFVSEGKDASNEGSIVLLFSFGETRVLLTGDLPNEERFLPEIPRADILKVAHHGSKYSTSVFFLDRVQPKDAVVSVGKNSYGHPASETLERLQKIGANIFRTDLLGDIVYVCEKERCERKK